MNISELSPILTERNDKDESMNGSCSLFGWDPAASSGCPRGSAAELEFLRQQEDQLPYQLAYQAGIGSFSRRDGPTMLVIDLMEDLLE